MKKIFASSQLLIVGLILVSLVYGGLNVFSLNQKNQALNQKQIALEKNLQSLNEKIDKNNEEIAVVSASLKEQTQNNNSKIVASHIEVAPESQPATNLEETPVNKPEPIVKTIVKTKTVTVKEEEKPQVSTTIKGVGSYKIDVKDNDTAFSVLKNIAAQNGFKVEYESYDFGVFVTSINGIKATGNQYWAFYYNGQYSQVGASIQKVSAGDTIFWQLESF